ncbi:1,3-propanediol dehydrogenase [Maioricimonas rarisocia]|uniref:1,3-propanediol dehydrogenase n=1 Tax=Maioricimonas rarisocia TaxID=2528026 RepID=A0A517Z9F9_9PLAN|nr:iron-containing alcohol dehydrogenase [Maioricimonas rarisocia]QDU39089.1 1,3-propanediol dehydrogenase [Maioricimonas rarisocia]
MTDPQRTTWGFSTAGRILFGRGAVDQIGLVAQRLRSARALIVTDPAIAAAGLVERVAVPLTAMGVAVEVFDGGAPEPSFDVARRSIEFARECQPDTIIGLGGGSNMDLAKVTAVGATFGGDFEQYVDHDNIPGPVRPLICVPTTAGTGSEVSHSAVLTDTENNIKVSTLSEYLRPRFAIVDPEMTRSCPKKPSADAGIDALTHAVEAYLATRYDELPFPAGSSFPYEGAHPLGQSLAEQAIRLVGQHLVRVVNEPDDMEAREGMALAATLAGMAFSNCGVALVHGMEYPLGGALHCSHGEGNGLLLPYVMRFNLPERTAELARIAGLLGEDVAGLSDEAAAGRAIDAVMRLNEAIGIPTRIRELGGTREQLPEFARKAFAIKRLTTLTPRRPGEADILAIYEEAF